MLERIAGLGIVPGIICIIIGFFFVGYFWLPRRNSKSSRREDSVAGLLAKILIAVAFLASGVAIVLGHLT